MKMKNQMGVPVGQRRSGFDENLTGHFEMENQGPIRSKVDEDELAFTPYFSYDGPG